MITEYIAVDNKGHKTSQRSEKIDQFRMKRIAVQNTAMITSLPVSSLAIKYQGLSLEQMGLFADVGDNQNH